MESKLFQNKEKRNVGKINPTQCWYNKRAKIVVWEDSLSLGTKLDLKMERGTTIVAHILLDRNTTSYHGAFIEISSHSCQGTPFIIVNRGGQCAPDPADCISSDGTKLDRYNSNDNMISRDEVWTCPNSTGMSELRWLSFDSLLLVPTGSRSIYISFYAPVDSSVEITIKENDLNKYEPGDKAKIELIKTDEEIKFFFQPLRRVYPNTEAQWNLSVNEGVYDEQRGDSWSESKQRKTTQRSINNKKNLVKLPNSDLLVQEDAPLALITACIESDGNGELWDSNLLQNLYNGVFIKKRNNNKIIDSKYQKLYDNNLVGTRYFDIDRPCLTVFGLDEEDSFCSDSDENNEIQRSLEQTPDEIKLLKDTRFKLYVVDKDLVPKLGNQYILNSQCILDFLVKPILTSYGNEICKNNTCTFTLPLQSISGEFIVNIIAEIENKPKVIYNGIYWEDNVNNERDNFSNFAVIFIFGTLGIVFLLLVILFLINRYLDLNNNNKDLDILEVNGNIRKSTHTNLESSYIRDTIRSDLRNSLPKSTKLEDSIIRSDIESFDRIYSASQIIKNKSNQDILQNNIYLRNNRFEHEDRIEAIRRELRLMDLKRSHYN